MTVKVTRKKRTPEQIAATNAKRKATNAAKAAANSVNAKPPVDNNDDSFTDPHGTHEPEAVNAKSEDSPDAKSEQPAQLPKVLQDRIKAMAGIQDDLAVEIEKFKSGQAYLPGDVPVTMQGVGGPGLRHGQRALNWIDKEWLDPLLHFRWSHKTMVDYHRADGYLPCDHVEFTRMVVARGGGHSFEATASGHVYSGDLIMIQVSKDWHDQLSKGIAKRTAAKEGRAKNNVYAKGEQLGVDVYEGGEALSPKMDRLLKFIEKELGPGAVDAYLGR